VPNAGRLPKRVGGGERDHDVARRDRRIAAVGGDPQRGRERVRASRDRGHMSGRTYRGSAGSGEAHGAGAEPSAEIDRGGACAITSAAADARSAEYRYGVVILLVLALLIFAIAAPAAAWSRAVALALESAALVVAVATSRARRVVRRRRAWVAMICAVACIAGVAAGLVPESVPPLLTGLVAFAIPAALVGGLLRLVRERGVTVHAVAGSLAIYLLVGLLFAWVVDVVAAVQSTPYFAQGSSGTEGQRVYFSFTVLTTTGFGDLTAATPVGRALAVLEMLIGQLYLVTVIGLVVTNFRGRGRRPTG
jgi:hypothetical protein